MKRINFIILGLIIFQKSLVAQGQFNNYWHFGDSAALIFNNNNISFGSSSIFSKETSTSYSDSTTNFVLYAGSSQYYDSISVFNKLNAQTPNGNGVFGHSSITQGTLLLNYPGSIDSLILLTIFYTPFPNMFDRVFSTIISISADSGRGDVISKNNALSANFNYLTEKMVAIKHGNGRDWWLLLHGYDVITNKNYIKYLITPYGVVGPFTQYISNSNWKIGDATGQMAASPQGDKIAFAGLGGTLDVLDFDRCSGLLTMNMALGDSADPYYGCCFSPNGNFVYATAFTGSWGHNNLYQFDLMHHSKDTLWHTRDSVNTGQLQLGPDNKIYLTCLFGKNDTCSIVDSSNHFLSVINFPDSQGVSCNFVPYQVYLGGRRSFIGLPNIPNYNLGRLVGSACDTLTGLSHLNSQNVFNVTISPNPASNNFYINYNIATNQNLLFVLYDCYGKEMLRKMLYGTFKNLLVQTNEISDGIYFWSVTSTKNQKQNGKVVIIR